MIASSESIARLTVRLGAIVENFRLCQEFSATKAAGVVKADAYGLGAEAVARALGEAGCDTFFVARLEEGIAVRPVARQARIFVLDGVFPESAEQYVAYRLTPVLNSLDDISTWSHAAAARHTKLDAAIHFDTGMNRLGLPPDELSALSAEVTQRLSGINTVLR